MSVSYCLLVAYSMIVIVDKQTMRNNNTHIIVYVNDYRMYF